MVKIILKNIDRKHTGQLSFYNKYGLKCCVNLPCLYDGLKIDYNGKVYVPECYIDEELLDLETDEIWINLSYDFNMFYELIMEYETDYISIKVNSVR